MEDQKGQEHIKLATDYQKSQLNLGHIVDSNRTNAGKTAKASNSEPTAGVPYGRVKAYSSAHKNQDANGKVLDMDDAIAQIETGTLPLPKA